MLRLRQLFMAAALALALLAPLSVLPAPASAQAPAGPPRKLTVAYLKSLSFSPLYLAVEKKYLAEEGIELDLQIIAALSEIIAFLGRGQIDAAVGNSGVPFINAVARGIDVRLVGGLGYAPSDPALPSANPIIMRKALADAGTVKSVAGLKGRKVAVNVRGGIIEYQMALGLRQGGLSIKDVEVTTIGFTEMMAALTNGAIDASILPEPLSTLSQQRQIGAVLVANPAPGAMLTSIMLGRTLVAEAEADTVRRLMRALRRAANELLTPADVMAPDKVPVWSKWTDVPPAVVAKTAPYTFARDLAIDLADLARQQQFLAETGQIKEALPPERLIDRRFAVTR